MQCDVFYDIPLLCLRKYFFSNKDAKVLFETHTIDSKITVNAYSITLFVVNYFFVDNRILETNN